MYNTFSRGLTLEQRESGAKAIATVSPGPARSLGSLVSANLLQSLSRLAFSAPSLTSLAHALAHLDSYSGHFATQFPAADILNSTFLERDLIGTSLVHQGSSLDINMVSKSHINQVQSLQRQCMHGSGCGWPLWVTNASQSKDDLILQVSGRQTF